MRSPERCVQEQCGPQTRGPHPQAASPGVQEDVSSAIAVEDDGARPADGNLSFAGDKLGATDRFRTLAPAYLDGIKMPVTVGKMPTTAAAMRTPRSSAPTLPTIPPAQPISTKTQRESGDSALLVTYYVTIRARVPNGSRPAHTAAARRCHASDRPTRRPNDPAASRGHAVPALTPGYALVFPGSVSIPFATRASHRSAWLTIHHPSEAQPQTIARKGTGSSVNNKPAVLSASLWRPLRVRDNLGDGIITQRIGR